jgi:hypothetical protein
MTDRIFEDQISFEALGKYGDMELYLYEDRSVRVKVTEGGGGYDTQHAIFNLTAEEATLMKQFLIKSGY